LAKTQEVEGCDGGKRGKDFGVSGAIDLGGGENQPVLIPVREREGHLAIGAKDQKKDIRDQKKTTRQEDFEQLEGTKEEMSNPIQRGPGGKVVLRGTSFCKRRD